MNEPFRHRLPAARVQDRVAFVTDRARGRSVAHVGFGGMSYRGMEVDRGQWLHGHLDRACASLVGLDADADAVADARAQGLMAHLVDCTDPAAVAAAGCGSFDVVVAGEVIEHLDSPGSFLDTLHLLVAPAGRLLLTTPNAHCPLGALAAAAGREYVNPDHLTAFTWYTLDRMLRSHGWRPVVWATSMEPPGRVLRGGGPMGARLRATPWALAHRAVATAARVSPFLAEGLLVEAVADLSEPGARDGGP